MECELDSMLDNIENKLNLNSNRKSFHYRIKSNLSLYSNETSKIPFCKNKSLRDSFIQNETERNYKSSLVNTEAIILSNNSKEIRKILRRELDPFIHNIKSELKMSLDHFHREVQCYNTFIPEIKELKESIDSCKKSIQLANEINDKKLNDQLDKIIELNSLNIELKDQLDDMKYKMALNQSDYSNLCSRVSICEKMKINYESFDEKIKDYYNQIEQKLHLHLSKRIEDNSEGVAVNKSNYDSALNSIIRLESEQLRIGNQIKELFEKNTKLSNTIDSNYRNSISNTSVILKNNEEIKLRFQYIEKRINEINTSAIKYYSQFEKKISVLNEDNSAYNNERRKIIETINALIIQQQEIEQKQAQINLCCPIHIKPYNNNSIINSLNNSEIVSKLYIIEEMLNEHHKLLVHHNTKYNNSKGKIPLIKEDKANNKTTKEIVNDKIIQTIKIINIDRYDI